MIKYRILPVNPSQASSFDDARYIALPGEENIFETWHDWRYWNEAYAPMWQLVPHGWQHEGDTYRHYDAALAFLLVLARVNPALPPRARSVEHAVSKIAACAVFLRTLREVKDAHVHIARALLSKASDVYYPLLASDITREIAARVIGSRRRHADDGGGHWRAVFDRLARAWINSDARRAKMDQVRTALVAFPFTTSAISALVGAEDEDDLAHALSRAEEAVREEWMIGAPDAPDAPAAPTTPDCGSGDDDDGEDAPLERVFAEEE